MISSQPNGMVKEAARCAKRIKVFFADLWSAFTIAARSKNAVPILLSWLTLLTSIITSLTFLAYDIDLSLNQIQNFYSFAQSFLAETLRGSSPGLSLVLLIFGGFILPIVVSGYAIIIKIILALMSALLKFVTLSIAWTVRLLLQGPGAWIMGLVVRNAAFGGQCKEVLWPHELPEKERARLEIISEGLNQRMSDLSRKTATQAGEALYSALAEGDAMQIKEHVRERLTDPKLAHCQYYCEDEIINRIAELIASPPSSLTSGSDISKQNTVFSAP